jgi:DNA primase
MSDFLKPPSLLEKSALGGAAESYHQQLMGQEGSELRAYLTESRGLSVETIVKFQLGVAQGLGVSPNHESKRGWLSIPYLSPTGVLSMRFRRPPDSDHQAKYWSPAGSKSRVFNTNALLNPGHWIAICEGEFDTMAATQAGIPAIGFPGVKSWQPYCRNMLSGFSRIIVLADNDDKDGQGAKFGEMIADQLEDVKVVLAPKGHDVNSALLELGIQGLRSHFGIDKQSE